MRRSRLRTATVTLPAAAALLAALASPAAAASAAPVVADAELAVSSPAAGALVGAPPPVVTLQLTDDLRSASAVVIDGCGRVVPGAVVVAGRRISVRLAIDHRDVAAEDHSMAGGAWRVRWQAVGTDGETSSGDVGFTVGGEQRCAELPRPLRAGHVAAAHDALAADVGGAAGGQEMPARGSSGGSVPLVPLLAVAGIGVLLAFVQLVVRRRGQRPSADPEGAVTGARTETGALTRAR